MQTLYTETEAGDPLLGFTLLSAWRRHKLIHTPAPGISHHPRTGCGPLGAAHTCTAAFWRAWVADRRHFGNTCANPELG